VASELDAPDEEVLKVELAPELDVEEAAELEGLIELEAVAPPDEESVEEAEADEADELAPLVEEPLWLDDESADDADINPVLLVPVDAARVVVPVAAAVVAVPVELIDVEPGAPPEELVALAVEPTFDEPQPPTPAKTQASITSPEDRAIPIYPSYLTNGSQLLT
jgi:hypothetical protein